MAVKRFQLPALSLLLGATLMNSAMAERTAIGDDGREILLKDNGTWEYQNNDRFATTSTGSRVRLKDDGSWQFIENQQVSTPKVYSESNLNIELGEVIIHTEKSPIPNSNNFRVHTETEIAINVMVSEVSKAPVSVNIRDKGLFRVTDNRDKDYEVLSVTPQQATLQPGNTYAFVVRIDDAPKHSFLSLGGQVKRLTVSVDKAVFGTDQTIELHKPAKQIREIVNGVEKQD